MGYLQDGEWGARRRTLVEMLAACLFGMHWGKLKYNHVVLLCPGIVWKRDWLLHVSGMAKSVVWPAQIHTRKHLSVMCVCAREFDGIICIISKCLTFHSTAPVSSFPLEYIHLPPPWKGYGYAILSSCFCFLINCCYFCFFFPPSCYSPYEKTIGRLFCCLSKG